MSRCLLQRRYGPDECGVVYASFLGGESLLRRRATPASCRSGGHEIWWTVDSESEEGAVRLLPFYVAERTAIAPVGEVEIP